MGGNQALFSIATALIPGLVLGGAVIERRADLAKRLRSRTAALSVVLFVAVGVAAEIMAIRGSIEPTISSFEQRFVVFFVVAATIGFGLVSMAPWLNQAAGRSLRRPGQIAAVGTFIIGSVIAQIAVSSSLDDASARNRLKTAAQTAQQASKARSNSDAAANAARTALLDTAQNTASTRRRSDRRAAARFLAELDDVACFPDFFAPTTTEAEQQAEGLARRGLRCIHQAANRFRTRVGYPNGDGGPDAAILVLAGDRVRRSAEAQLSARLDDALSALAYVDACRASSRLGCHVPKH